MPSCINFSAISLIVALYSGVVQLYEMNTFGVLSVICVPSTISYTYSILITDGYRLIGFICFTMYVLCYPTPYAKSVSDSLCTNLFSNGKYTVQIVTCPAVQPFSLLVSVCISDQQPGTVYIPMERPS